MAASPTPSDAMSQARRLLFEAGCRGRLLADAVERLEKTYAVARQPPSRQELYVPSTFMTGRELEKGWTDDAPEGRRPTRQAAIHAALALRAAVDEAIEAVPPIAPSMDGPHDSADRRWSVRTIGELRQLRGAILQGWGPDPYPTALPMVGAGVPQLLRETASAVEARGEEVASAILAGVAGAPAAVTTRESPPVTLPELGPRDREAWQASLVPGMTQGKIAAELNRRYPGENWTQPRVSEAIKRARAHAEASGLADKVSAARSRAPARTLDPATAEQGRRTDGRAHHLRERERQKAKDGDDEG